MIVVAEGDGLVLVEQEDHAHLTGDLAALVPPGTAHHAAFVAAARLHDNGWREADHAATVDAHGHPHTFTTVDDDTYEAVWRRGIDRAAATDALTGLLVGLHGARFFGGRTSPGMRALDAAERERQDRVLAELGLGGTWQDLPPAVAEASDRVALLDALSLMLCGVLPDEISASIGATRYTLTRTAEAVRVRPWPFAAEPAALPMELSVIARRVPAGPYSSDEALRGAMAEATPTAMPVAVG